MAIEFFKYQGAGNDFVMIDNREGGFKNDTKLVAQLCDRKFGIGADGLILLQKPEQPDDDFRMVYFNADGRESTMCGNGGRCIVDFAHYLGIFDTSTTFSAIDGTHKAALENGLVKLQMQDVAEIQKVESDYFLNTGSPHHVVFATAIQQLNVPKEGAAIRHNNRYKPDGTNVNFAETKTNFLFVRTFERGVEDETLACGTGVTAVALAAHYSGKVKQNEVAIKTPGGELSVSFEPTDNGYKNIWLTGPAEMVFKGQTSC